MTTSRKRNAVVIGGSEGIGFAAASALARDCARVVLIARDPAKLATAREHVAGQGAAVDTVTGDMAEPATLDALVALMPIIDILIVCGGGPPPGDVTTLSDDDWRGGFNAFALPVLRAMRALSPAMATRGWGRVIVVGSLAAKQPLDNLDLSNFFRAGLAAVLKPLSRKLAPSGVTVHMVCPGSILTTRSQKRIAARAEQQGKTFDEALAASQSSIPMKRLGSAEEVGELVAFLASERAGYMTGNVIQIDGGMAVSLT